MSDFVYTTAIKRLRALTKRIKVIPGGTSAGKTFGIIPILIDKAARIPNLEISIVSESVPHLRRGALKDFEKIMKWTNRWSVNHFNKTFLKYTFGNGSYIEFFSADQDDKLRGARRDILYINECNNVTWDAYLQLSIRTHKEIWLDFNPSNEFWAHEELSNDIDAEWLTLTYQDNEALQPAIITEIEKAREKAKTSSYWDNWWKVYGLGQLGKLEGVVLGNWSLVDEVHMDAVYLGGGMDFGYTNDPTTFIKAYQFNNQIIWDECIYQKGLKNNDIAGLLKSHGVKYTDPVYADSAEPKSIDEINSFGFRIKGADKGADSINFGISILQEEPFLVTRRSTNLINELRKYCWDTDKAGKTLNRPIDAFNHAIDAMRYFAMMRLKKKQPMPINKKRLSEILY